MYCYVTASVMVYCYVTASAVWCYQCIDAGDDTDCRDAGKLLKFPEEKKDDHKRNKYYKECSGSDTMCMIEIYSRGRKSSHSLSNSGETTQ